MDMIDYDLLTIIVNCLVPCEINFEKTCMMLRRSVMRYFIHQTRTFTRFARHSNTDQGKMRRSLLSPTISRGKRTKSRSVPSRSNFWKTYGTRFWLRAVVGRSRTPRGVSRNERRLVGPKMQNNDRGKHFGQRFHGPITLRHMRDPVVASDGHSYEREAIMEVLSTTGTSPITRSALLPQVYSNHNLRKRIELEFNEVGKRLKLSDGLRVTTFWGTRDTNRIEEYLATGKGAC